MQPRLPPLPVVMPLGLRAVLPVARAVGVLGAALDAAAAALGAEVAHYAGLFGRYAVVEKKSQLFHHLIVI